MKALFKHSIAYYIFLAIFLNTSVALAAETSRKIEEVVVYGQKTEATVSDTSIAITALDEDFLKDMGVQGPNELVNFIPATTRTDWDIKIRGVGRNFRGLGGDPGVGTYFNGIYSPDFGIASTEGGLYDIKRIEVLRGPQGTLYGRNSIGGVINYVTNQPNHDEFEAQLRLMLGQYNTNEYFGFISGPITESLAYRFVGVKRLRDGAVEGFAGTEDLEGVDDQNFALILDWQATDNLTFNLRVNDRQSDRKGNFGNGGHAITSEGPCIGVHPIDDADDCDPRYRVARETRNYAPGFRPVDQAYRDKYGDLADNAGGAAAWIHPTTGAIHYGAYNRPGVDSTNKWPYMPSGNFMSSAVGAYDVGDADAPDVVALTNNSVSETFDHQSASLVADWEISDKLSVRYLGNYQEFEYYFNRDNDFSNNYVSDNNDTVIAATESWSHELRLFWEIGDRWTATSGLYIFQEDRDQWYGIRERGAQGRVENAVQYGPDSNPTLLLDALAVVGWIVPDCMVWQTEGINAGDADGYGQYCGDPGERYSRSNDTGAMYEHRNIIETTNKAFYTQGDFRFNDQWSLTLGFRYSEDNRDGLEQRGGYSELNANDYSAWLPWAITQALDGSEGLDAGDFFGAGVNGLAAMNVALGAATFSGDPDFPITPTCELTAEDCAHPLRLEGIPISWGHRTSGKFEPDPETTFRVNLNWTPTDNTLLYFGVTSGYRAGGWNMGGPDNRAVVGDLRTLLQYQGENLVSYELGYKGTLLDGRLQVNTAIYYYDYDDYQDHVERWETESGNFNLPPGIAAPGGRGAVSVTTNIAHAVNKGFEIDTLYLFNDAWTIGGNYSYTSSQYDAPFTFFNEDDPRYPRNVFGGDLSQDPCTMEPELRDLYCLNVDGYDLQGIPKHKLSAWTSYVWNMDIGSITWYGAYSYTGEYITHAFDRPWDRVPERERIDTRLTFRDQANRWNASIFVDNVLDNTYIRSADMDARRTGYGPNWAQRVVSLYPRYWGVEATYNFGQ
ncbi:MAG TPA: TonB-dependent receptor [Pseudomonadales bacterium]|nr:TonB-dependent receptor [Pseudomonadales bacterium]